MLGRDDNRNPKIAEFLKAYNFVKEYGEGVDRMCKELEVVGQRLPEYYTNAFMLKTVIYNNENPAIQDETPAIQDETPAIHSRALIRNKMWNLGVEKLDNDTFSVLIDRQKYIANTRDNLLKVYSSIDTNQIFGAPEVKEILGCTVTVSKEILKRFRDMGMVVEVKGKGKGKYRFIYQSELKDQNL